MIEYRYRRPGRSFSYSLSDNAVVIEQKDMTTSARTEVPLDTIPARSGYFTQASPAWLGIAALIVLIALALLVADLVTSIRSGPDDYVVLALLFVGMWWLWKSSHRCSTEFHLTTGGSFVVRSRPDQLEAAREFFGAMQEAKIDAIDRKIRARFEDNWPETFAYLLSLRENGVILNDGFAALRSRFEPQEPRRAGFAIGGDS